jgi:hypothetical protein
MSFMLRSKSYFGRKGSRTGSLRQLRDWDVTLPLLKFAILLSFAF